VQKELREETRMRKERQRQLQEQMRRRQLLRQQRITRNTQRGRSGAGGDTLRQFMETVTGGSSAAVLPSTRLGRRSGVMHTAASAPVALALRPSHETAVAIEMASSVPIPEVAEAVAPRIPGSVDHV
jgi:septal ring-binding cell division protein DamX